MAEPVIERVTPTVVVGLGGTGAKVVHVLKRRLEEVPVVRFLVIDSDPRAQSDEDTSARLSDNEFVYLGVGERVAELIQELPRLGKDTTASIRSWFPEPPSEFYANSRDTLGEGAKQIRPLGRLALFYRAPLIQDRIAQHLSYVVGRGIPEAEDKGYEVDRGNKRIFIISSLGGGQGSSIFLDVAYLAAYAARRLGGVEVNGVLVLPSAFLGESTIEAAAVYANTYAALRELEHFMLSRKFGCLYSRECNVEVEGRPFRYTYLVSGKPRKGGLLDLPVVIRLISEALYSHLALDTATTGSQFQDTINQHLDTHLNEEGVEETKAYASFGYRTVRLDGGKIAEYCRNRLAEKICHELLKDPDSRKVEKQASDFATRLRLETLKNRLPSPAAPKLRTVPLKQTTLRSDLERAESRVWEDLTKLKPAIKEGAEAVKQAIRGEIAVETERLANDVSYGPGFAAAFTEKLRHELNGVRQECDRELNGQTGKPGLRGELNNKKAGQRNFESDLEKLLGSSKPFWLRKGSIRKDVAKISSSINRQVGIELDIYRLELVEQLLTEAQSFLVEAGRRLNKAIYALQRISEENFYPEKRRLREGIERERGEFFERQVRFTHKELKKLSECPWPGEAGGLMASTDCRFFTLDELEEEQEGIEKTLLSRVKEFCWRKFGEWEGKGIVDVLENRSELAKELEHLQEGAFALWDIGTDIESRYIVSRVTVDRERKDRVQDSLSRITAETKAVGISEKQELSLAYYEYGAPLSWLKEMKECWRDYEQQKGNRDLHVFAEFTRSHKA